MNRSLVAFFCLLTAATLSAADQIKYSVVPNFFEVDPGGKQLGPCHGAALIDKAGNIYITTDTPRGIVVYSPEGKFLKAVGPTQIHGAEIREENGVEYIYAARPNFNEVIKLKMDGEQLWSITYP